MVATDIELELVDACNDGLEEVSDVSRCKWILTFSSSCGCKLVLNVEEMIGPIKSQADRYPMRN